MKKNIELHKRKVQYTLKVSDRAKRMRIAVYCDGGLVVTSPKNIHLNIIEQFLIRKSQWILDKIDSFSSFESVLSTKDSKEEYLKNKGNALLLAKEKIDKFNKIYKFKYNQINIKNQKTRWGSCSRKGNLNFNYKIALLSDKLSDYIIIHELCHLGEFNHSQKFWNLVAKAMPDHKDIRNSLKSRQL